MNYPASLVPSAIEQFRLADGRTVGVPKATPTFRTWSGPPPGDTYGGKPVVDVEGRPTFAELAVLETFRRAQWDGVWIDTYRNRFRAGYWGVEPVTALPARPGALLERILAARGTGRSGTWDVYSWRGDDVLFAEAKRAGRDQIRPTQVTWLEAALRVGVRIDSLLVVEWTLA